jgi:hypothetical protein
MLGRKYHYTADGILLRVSGYLTPDQADTLRTALAAITGRAVAGPIQPSPPS